jgi:hypothetical protein
MSAHSVEQTPALTRFDFGFWRIPEAPSALGDFRTSRQSGLSAG